MSDETRTVPVELKPCPFCGLDPISGRIGNDDGGYWDTSCPNCYGASGTPHCGVHADNETEAAEIWNRRAAAPQDDGWRPIETAPKDGTPILVCRKPEHGYARLRIGVDWWQISANGQYHCWWRSRRDAQPTHWMRLPEPPKEEGK